MTTIETTIEFLVKKNKIFRFKNELDKTEDKDRQTQIKTILNQLEGNKEFLNNDNNNARDKLNLIFDKIDVETLKNKWSKLKVEQRVDRLHKYFDTLPEGNNKDIALKELTELLNNKKLKTVKEVIYNTTDCKIEKINILEYCEEKKEYSVKKPKLVKKKIIKVETESDTESD